MRDAAFLLRRNVRRAESVVPGRSELKYNVYPEFIEPGLAE